MFTAESKIKSFNCSPEYVHGRHWTQVDKLPSRESGNGSGYLSGYRPGYSAEYLPQYSAEYLYGHTPVLIEFKAVEQAVTAATTAKKYREQRVKGELVSSVKSELIEGLVVEFSKKAKCSPGGKSIIRAVLQYMDSASMRLIDLGVTQLAEKAQVSEDTVLRQMARITEAIPGFAVQTVVGSKGRGLQSVWAFNRPNKATYRHAQAMCAEGRLPHHQVTRSGKRSCQRAVAAQLPLADFFAPNPQNAPLRDSQDSKESLESKHSDHSHQTDTPVEEAQKNGMVSEGSSGEVEMRLAEVLLDLNYDPNGALSTAKQTVSFRQKAVTDALKASGKEILALIERELAGARGKNNPKGVLAHRIKSAPSWVIREGKRLKEVAEKQAEESARLSLDASEAALKAGLSLTGVPEPVLPVLATWIRAKKTAAANSNSPGHLDWVDREQVALSALVTAAKAAVPSLADVEARVSRRLVEQGSKPCSMAFKLALRNFIKAEVFETMGITPLLKN